MNASSIFYWTALPLVLAPLALVRRWPWTQLIGDLGIVVLGFAAWTEGTWKGHAWGVGLWVAAALTAAYVIWELRKERDRAGEEVDEGQVDGEGTEGSEGGED